MMSASDLVIFPIQDILRYGADTRLNTPGVPENNWRYRVTREQIFGIDKNYWNKMNKIYARL